MLILCFVVFVTASTLLPFSLSRALSTHVISPLGRHTLAHAQRPLCFLPSFYLLNALVPLISHTTTLPSSPPSLPARALGLRLLLLLLDALLACCGM